MKTRFSILTLLCTCLVSLSCEKQPHSAIELNNFQVLFYDSFSQQNYSKADLQDIKSQLFLKVDKKIFARKEHQTLWLKTKLPKWQGGSRYLFLTSIDQFAQIYIGNKIIYQSGDWSSPESLKFTGYYWHLVQIPEKYNGQETFFRIFSRHYNIGLFGEAKLGTRADLFFAIFYQDLSAFLIATILMTLGLIMLAAFLRRVKNLAYLWLGLFAICIGLYSFLRLDLRTFLLAEGPHLFYAELFSLYSLIIWLTLFFTTIFGQGFRNSLRYLWQFQVVFTLFCIGFAFFGSLSATLPYFQLLLLFSGVVMVLHLAYYAYQKILYASTFLFGFILLFAGGLIDILANVQILPSLFNLTPYGSFFFIISLTVIIIRRYSRTHKLVRDFSHELIKRQQVEQQLLYTTEKAKAADKAKTEFLATMSHEIRTPLNIILGMGQLLSDEKLNEKQSRYVSSLKRSGEVLMLLINDVLDISKIEAGKLHILNEPFDFKATVGEIYDLFKSKAERKELQFTLTHDKSILSSLKGDRNRLRQILFNLVSNAIKFTAAGQIEIKTKLEQDTDFDCYIEIAVIDTGKGIEPTMLDSIFEPFTQEDASTTREYGGSGLGLAISQKLAHLMDGNIRVKSKQNEGSEFIVSLHFFKDFQISARKEKEIEIEVSRVETARLPQNLKVLLVEDLEENRLLMNAFLKSQPITISEVINGKEAVEKVEKKEFQIILMDMQMPILDGYQATKKIRQLEARLGRKPATIIAVTGNAMSDEIEQAFASGCDHHLAKPISKANLLHLLNQVVQNRNLN